MVGKAGNVASRAVKVCDKATADWIRNDRENAVLGVLLERMT
jgi:hypothetical protein